MTVFLDPQVGLLLVVTLVTYWSVSSVWWRKVILAAASFIFIFRLHQTFAFASLLTSLVMWLGARQFAKRRDRKYLWLFGLTMLLLVLLILFKYGIALFSQIYGHSGFVANYLLMPLGISYFCFRALQYVFDSYRGLIKEHGFVDAFAFLVFFPLLAAGPIETFQNFYGQQAAKLQNARFVWGVRRALLGYFKKLLLLEVLFKNLVFIPLFAVDPASEVMSPLIAYQCCVVLFIYAYTDLSAYTDIAIGVSAMFGFKVVENFNRPLLQRNLADFWRSWHISLSSWCRNNIYFPVFGLTKKPWLALYACMLTMGLWHHINMNWLCWGLYHGTGLVVVMFWGRWLKRHKQLKAVIQKQPFGLLAWFMTFSYVAVGYSFSGNKTFPAAIVVLKSLVGLN